MYEWLLIDATGHCQSARSEKLNWQLRRCYPGEIIFGSEKRSTKSLRIFEFPPEKRSEFSPNNLRTFHALFPGETDLKKLTENSRHFSIPDPQANSKKRFTKIICAAPAHVWPKGIFEGREVRPCEGVPVVQMALQTYDPACLAKSPKPPEPRKDAKKNYEKNSKSPTQGRAPKLRKKYPKNTKMARKWPFSYFLGIFFVFLGPTLGGGFCIFFVIFSSFRGSGGFGLFARQAGS